MMCRAAYWWLRLPSKVIMMARLLAKMHTHKRAVVIDKFNIKATIRNLKQRETMRTVKRTTNETKTKGRTKEATESLARTRTRIAMRIRGRMINHDTLGNRSKRRKPSRHNKTMEKNPKLSQLKILTQRSRRSSTITKSRINRKTRTRRLMLVRNSIKSSRKTSKETNASRKEANLAKGRPCTTRRSKRNSSKLPQLLINLRLRVSPNSRIPRPLLNRLRKIMQMPTLQQALSSSKFSNLTRQFLIDSKQIITLNL